MKEKIEKTILDILSEFVYEAQNSPLFIIIMFIMLIIICGFVEGSEFV